MRGRWLIHQVFSHRPHYATALGWGHSWIKGPNKMKAEIFCLSFKPTFQECPHPPALHSVKLCLKFKSSSRLCNHNNIKWIMQLENETYLWLRESIIIKYNIIHFITSKNYIWCKLYLVTSHATLEWVLQINEWTNLWFQWF